MKGKHTVRVSGRNVQYTLELERNITILRGDSGTGKTTLVGMLQDYESLGKQSGITVDCDKQCRVLTKVDWEDRLQLVNNCIVFIDEGNDFVGSQAFAHAISGTDNYYVLITRESLYQLPYSVDAVLELRKTTSRFKRIYNRTYPYYKNLPRAAEEFARVDRVLTEDSNAGHQMFAHIAEEQGCRCESAQGKSNIYGRLRSQQGTRTLVVADGAAFGADMDMVYRFQNRHPNDVTLYLPESFEWLILKSGIIRDNQIADVLADPSEHIDSVNYFSWEQFFTDFLTNLTSGQPYMRYNKQRLNEFYLQGENVRKFLEAMEKD